MSNDAFAAVTRGAAEAVSRRSSLLTLGGAALAAGLAPPRGVEAKKSANKKCKRQVGQCTTFFDEFCEMEECEAEQRESVHRCCERLQSCNAAEFLECLFSVMAA